MKTSLPLLIIALLVSVPGCLAEGDEGAELSGESSESSTPHTCTFESRVSYTRGRRCS